MKPELVRVCRKVICIPGNNGKLRWIDVVVLIMVSRLI